MKMEMEDLRNDIDRGKKMELVTGKTCPSAILSTKNIIRTDLGSNPALVFDRPATNRLSHGKEFSRHKFVQISYKTHSCYTENSPLPFEGQSVHCKSGSLFLFIFGIIQCMYVQGDSFGTRPKKMRISQRLFIRF